MAMKPIAPTQAPPTQATPARATEAATAFVITAPEPKPSATNHTGAPAGQVQRQTEVKMTMDKTVKSAEEFVSFGQGNFEAMMKASQIWAAGVQDMQKAVSATAQAQLETAMGTFKALSGVKSLKEAMDLQTTLARASMEAAMTETGKLTDASMKLAEQALAPITARVTLAVEKFGRAA